MSKIDIKGLVEKYGRGFLYKNEHGDQFFCYDNDRSYCSLGHYRNYKGDDMDDWAKFVETNTFCCTFQFIDADGVESTAPVYYDEDSFLQDDLTDTLQYEHDITRIIRKAISVNNSITFYPDNTIQLFSLDSESEIEWKNTPENREIIEQYLDALIVVKEIENGNS